MNAPTNSQKAAMRTLMANLKNIPGGDVIADDMTRDWILNVLAENAEAMTVENIKEAVQGTLDLAYENSNEPKPVISEEQYQVILDAFRKFVNAYYATTGGRRVKRKARKTRKSKKQSKKTRKH